MADPATTAGLDNNGIAFFKRPYFDLFLISFVILFFELACIRWFGSMVVFLTFFTNVVLLACFLGMSVGCMTASRKQNYILSLIPLTVTATLLACILLKAYGRFTHFAIDIGGQPTAQLIYFGAESRFNDPTRFVIPIWLIIGACFSLVALMFVGLGQILGRAFDAIPNRIAAYTANICGSLLGILIFFVVSLFQMPPYIWFAVCILIFFYFLRRLTWLQAGGAILILCFVSFGSVSSRQLLASLGKSDVRFNEEEKEIWSPYYRVSYSPGTGHIVTNNIGHQSIVPIGDSGAAYALPHLLIRDAVREPLKDVLIIGAGSGNDVAAAVAYAHKDTHIDAVEIDPVILSIGKAAHPNRPYQDARVTHHLDDGRNFLKKNADKKYDLIVYAVVDSLVLHSGYSSLRLESFLFTRDAFEDIRNRLGLTAGSQFVVIGEDNVVIMKRITRPSMRDFDSLIGKARRQARDTGMTKSDISHSITEARGGK